MERNFKDVDPGVWVPENEGDAIEGTLIRVIPKEGEISARYYLEQENGSIVLVWGSVVIDDRMQLVSMGDYLRITYKGLEKTKTGRKVKIVKVQKAQPIEEEDIV